MKLQYVLICLAISALLPSAFTACSSNLPDAVTQNQTSAASTSPTVTTVTPETDPVVIVTGGTGSTSTLTLAVSNAAPAGGTTITLTAAGGTPPYTFSQTGGSGTLSGATYITPSTAETVVFKVTDASLNVATANASVSGPAMVQIYQFYVNGAHFFTTINDGYVAGITPDGPAYKLVVNPISGHTQPLYRCVIRNATNYFFETDDSGCEGQLPNATLGSIYVNQEIGTTPLYRYRCGLDHIDSRATSVSGCTQESTLGYVPAN